MIDAKKETFLKQWPGGYRENWEVYGKATNVDEASLVSRALAPFYNRDQVCLEVGCGLGFWTEKYLSPNFKKVIALDLLPADKQNLKGENITYIEVPDRNFKCHGVEDESVDFVWSFGVFCHMSIDAQREYLRNIHRVLKPDGWAVLYFSNTDRRPCPNATEQSTSEDVVPWVRNNLEITTKMLHEAGLYSVAEPVFGHIDTIVQCQKIKSNIVPGKFSPPMIAHRDGFGKWLQDNGFRGEGVEVGVLYGALSEIILQGWSGTLHLVDPWVTQDDKIYLDGSNRVDFSQAHAEVIEKMKKYGSRAVIHRKFSADAVNDFKDGSLDFVYIDGNHSYVECRRDIERWLPKVRSGGIICGHDFANDYRPGVYDCGVMKAVAEWSERSGIPYYASPNGCSSWWAKKP